MLQSVVALFVVVLIEQLSPELLQLRSLSLLLFRTLSLLLICSPSLLLDEETVDLDSAI